MTTKTNTTKTTKPATKRASAAKRKTSTLSDVERSAATLIGKVNADTITSVEAIAEAQSLASTITRRSVRDTLAMGAAVGTIAAHDGPKPDAKGKLPAAKDVAAAFLKTSAGKGCGWEAGTITQYVHMARVPNRHELVTIWEGFQSVDVAVASDPKAYLPNTVGFLRFASAWRGGKINAATGVVFASKDAARKDDTAQLRAIVSEANSAKATARSEAAKRSNARKAIAEAKASDKRIGKVNVADVAALTKPQRKTLRALLDSLDA